MYNLLLVMPEVVLVRYCLFLTQLQVRLYLIVLNVTLKATSTELCHKTLFMLCLICDIKNLLSVVPR